jgi:thiol-disulfide isomerase/thioredoxin
MLNPAIKVMRGTRSNVNNSSRLVWIMMVAFALAIALPASGKQPLVEGGSLDFQLPDLAGKLVTSTDSRFAGKVVLVDLWATWCPPCLSEIPTLVDVQKQYGDRGFVIVAIAFETEDVEQRRTRLRDFATRHGINYLVLDGGPPESFEAALPAVKNVKGFPVEIVIDRAGRVRSARNGYGFKKKWAKRLRKEIEALLSEPAD